MSQASSDEDLYNSLSFEECRSLDFCFTSGMHLMNHLPTDSIDAPIHDDTNTPTKITNEVINPSPATVADLI
jgi:hypothetical protein